MLFALCLQWLFCLQLLALQEQEDNTKGKGNEQCRAYRFVKARLCRMQAAAHQLLQRPHIIGSAIDAARIGRPAKDLNLNFARLGAKYHLSFVSAFTHDFDFST